MEKNVHVCLNCGKMGHYKGCCVKDKSDHSILRDFLRCLFYFQSSTRQWFGCHPNQLTFQSHIHPSWKPSMCKENSLK